MIFLRRAMVASILASGLAALPASAQDNPGATAPAEPSDAAKQEASERFLRGVVFYNNADYRAALIEFRRAHEIAPNYRVLFNIGQASFGLNEYVDAAGAFEAYLAQGGEEISADRRAKVTEELKRLRNYVAKIDLKVFPDGAEIAVDDVVVGKAPLSEPLSVSTGRRKLTLSMIGYAPLQRFVDIAGGELQTIELRLTSLTPTETAPAPEPVAKTDEPATESTALGTPFWVSLGLTGAFAIAASATGGLAISANRDYQNELDAFPGDPAAVEAASSDLRTFSTATDVLIGLAAASGVAAVVFIFVGRDDTPEQAASGRSVQLVAGPLAAGLGGTF
jgi:tetratricopeptide (TPR) repeat protein